MFVAFDCTDDNVMFGPFETWEEVIRFTDHNLGAGMNTEIRLLIDPRFMNAFTSTANE